MLTRLLPAAAAVVFSASAFAQTLSLGDAMPTIGDDANWLQGSPVSAWEEGQIYVLDFWATWCGPCIASIPHINELSQKHADDGVNVIGMAIWPREGMTPTDEYVQERGDEMSYRIAEDVGGKLAERYMRATGSNGIPTIMIVNRAGQLVWKGHPMSGFDDALESVIDGTFDLNAAKKLAAIEKQGKEILATVREKQNAQDWDGVVAGYRQVVELDGFPFAAYYGYQAFTTLASSERANSPEQAYTYAGHLMERFAGDEEVFSHMAQFIAEGPIADESRDLDLALKLAETGVKNAPASEALPHAMLASVHHARGEHAAAIKAQTKAVEIATNEKADPRMVKEFEAALDEYKSHATN